MVGLKRRLSRLLGNPSEPVIFCPVDDSLLVGPENGLSNMQALLSKIVRANPSAIIAFKGTLVNYFSEMSEIPSVLNCTASVIGDRHVDKVLVNTVEDALRLGADAVAGHINVTSATELEQMETFGKLVRRAERYGLPVLAIAYPRRKGSVGDDNYIGLRESDPPAYQKFVAHAVRVAVELGANIVKTQYTGSRDSFVKIIEASQGIPVVTAGGPLRDKAKAIKDASDALLAGAAGVSFGRNVFARNDPGEMVDELRVALRLAKDVRLASGNPAVAPVK